MLSFYLLHTIIAIFFTFGSATKFYDGYFMVLTEARYCYTL